MAMMPKRVKYRKKQRGRIKGEAQRGNAVAFGEYGLQCLDQGRISARQIEAGRIGSSHYLKGEGRIWIRVFPHKSMTSTPAETRMGKGKGAPEKWVAVVKPGRILFEIAGVHEELALQAMRLAAHKMPVRTRVVARETEVI